MKLKQRNRFAFIVGAVSAKTVKAATQVVPAKTKHAVLKVTTNTSKILKHAKEDFTCAWSTEFGDKNPQE